MTTSNGCNASAVSGTSVVVWIRWTVVPRASNHAWKSDDGFDPGFPRIAMFSCEQAASRLPLPASARGLEPPAPVGDEAPPVPRCPAVAVLPPPEVPPPEPKLPPEAVLACPPPPTPAQPRIASDQAVIGAMSRREL